MIKPITDYGRKASQAIIRVMLAHAICILRFRQHVTSEGKLHCGMILQCTDCEDEEILEHDRLGPLVVDLERALSALQAGLPRIQGNYSCYLLEPGSELPAGIQYRIAEGGDQLCIEPRDHPSDHHAVACNLGLYYNSNIFTYITHSLEGPTP